jgi:glyoxylase-like metal-dependent hydrolase (beta-lactamase superfamily II)
MFGVVPRVLWESVVDVDDRNRILLATRTLLAVHRQAGRVVLVDTGCGSKWSPEQAERYAIRPDPTAIETALAGAGASAADVTDIVISHLHFDHNGGLTDWYDDADDGRTALRYPNAMHWIHRDHWNHAQRPHIKDRASFLRHDFEALEEAGVLRFVEGESPESSIPGIDWIVSHGHTPAQLHPIFGDGDEGLVFAGDLAPTVAHLRMGWVMAYDVLPMTTIDEKQRLLRRCLEHRWMLAFPHDPSTGGVILDGSVDRPVVSRSVPI